MHPLSLKEILKGWIMTKFINTWQIHVLWLKCHSFTMLSQNALLYMTWKRNKTSLYLKTILVYHLIISLKLFIGLISLVFDNKIYTTIIFCVIVSKNMLLSDIPNFSAWSINTIIAQVACAWSLAATVAAPLSSVLNVHLVFQFQTASNMFTY